MTGVWVIVGLGNPGIKYENTRHNIGFRVVRSLFEVMSGSSDWPDESKASGAGAKESPWVVDPWRDRWQARLIEGRREDLRIVGVLPQTFMNLSGESVGPAWRWYNSGGSRDLGKLIVVHDEVDLPLGRLQLKRGGGEAGHNGLKSISQVLGSKDYVRLRFGVGRSPIAQQDLASWVLEAFSAEDEKVLDALSKRAVEGLGCLISGGLVKAQQQLNALTL